MNRLREVKVRVKEREEAPFFLIFFSKNN